MTEETRQKVLKDTDDKTRIEIWTDGEWIKVGRDIDKRLCLTFRYDDETNWYHRFRNMDTPAVVTITDERPSDNRYLVNCRGLGTFRFFEGRHLVLEVDDHELGAIRSAYSLAREVRQADYDYIDIARSYVNALIDSSLLEIEHLDVREASGRGEVKVVHSNNPVCINESFMDRVKTADHTDWTGVYHELDETCDGFSYKFNIDAAAIREAEESSA